MEMLRCGFGVMGVALNCVSGGDDARDISEEMLSSFETVITRSTACNSHQVPFMIALCTKVERCRCCCRHRHHLFCWVRS